MPDGVLQRELPDGSREFVLEDPVLRALIVDGGLRLRFGRTDVVVTGPCSLEVDGVGHRLDPGAAETLAPLLSCYPGTARWIWASPDGRLTMVLMQGQRLVVPGPLAPSSWSVGASPGAAGDAAKPAPAHGPEGPVPVAGPARPARRRQV